MNVGRNDTGSLVVPRATQTSRRPDRVQEAPRGTLFGLLSNPASVSPIPFITLESSVSRIPFSRGSEKFPQKTGTNISVVRIRIFPTLSGFPYQHEETGGTRVVGTGTENTQKGLSKIRIYTFTCAHTHTKKKCIFTAERKKEF